MRVVGIQAKYLPPVAGLAAAAVVTGKFSANTADRVRGAFVTDAAGTLVLRWHSETGVLLLEYTVPVDVAQTHALVYHFDVIRQGYYFTYEFTQGGAPSTFLQAEVAALTD